MRKRCNRFRRPVSTLITPDQHASLILRPRLHLEMLLAQVVDVDYQHSVLSVFDLAFALAHLQNKPKTQIQFEDAQRVLIRLIKEERGPSHEEGELLCQRFNQADRNFGIQNTTVLVRAIEMVQWANRECGAIQGGVETDMAT